MISAKALGVLCHLVYTGTKPTVSALQETLGGGRDLFLSALKELVDEGLVERNNIHINGGLRKECRLTDMAELYLQGLGYPTSQMATWGRESRPIELQNQLINPNNKTYITSKEVTRENPRNENKTFNISVKEKEMPYQFFNANESEDDYTQDGKEARRKYRDAKMKEEQVKFVSTKRAKLGDRHNLAIEKWGSNEIAYEFMDRLTYYFHIKSNITVRRITGAFAKMRMVHQTDGETEYKMLDLFFETTKFEKYDDGEHMWKLFITRSPELAVQAKRMVKTPEEKETAAIQAAKSQEWLNE
jgi:DNA-binding HxlR family transcriptional regulator